MKCKILKNSIIILTVLLVFSLIAEAYILNNYNNAYLSQENYLQTSGKHIEKAVVLGHLSGSVVRVRMINGSEYSVQLAGAFTPFSGKDFEKSFEYSRENLPAGMTIFLERASNYIELKGSNYIIRYVWLNEPGEAPKNEEIKNNLYDARLVMDGYGYSIPSWYNSSYNNYIGELGKYASKNKLGLWKMQN